MKRAFDCVAAFLGLVFLSPLLLIVAVWIKLSSPGPVLYSQARVGLNGKVFHLYKFRSMIPGADKMSSSIVAAKDPRITAVGRVLRRTKLDELPQLWNVLVGELSLVGPRPDVPEIVSTYTAEMRRILSVPQGMTSVAALHLRDEGLLLDRAADPDHAYVRIVLPAKIALNMAHVERQSLLFDLRILFQTLWVLMADVLGVRHKESPIVREIRDRIAARNGRGSGLSEASGRA